MQYNREEAMLSVKYPGITCQIAVLWEVSLSIYIAEVLIALEHQRFLAIYKSQNVCHGEQGRCRGKGRIQRQMVFSKLL